MSSVAFVYRSALPCPLANCTCGEPPTAVWFPGCSTARVRAMADDLTYRL